MSTTPTVSLPSSATSKRLRVGSNARWSILPFTSPSGICASSTRGSGVCAKAPDDPTAAAARAKAMNVGRAFMDSPAPRDLHSTPGVERVVHDHPVLQHLVVIGEIA